MSEDMGSVEFVPPVDVGQGIDATLGDMRRAAQAAGAIGLPSMSSDIARWVKAVEASRHVSASAESILQRLRAVVPEDSRVYCYVCERGVPSQVEKTPYPGDLGSKYGQMKTEFVCSICGHKSYGSDPFVDVLVGILYA